MKAHGRKIVLKVEPINDKIGSIIMPESAVKKNVKTREGIVVSLGDDPDFDYEVEIGNKVLYDRSGELHEDDGVVLINKSALLYVRE